MIPRTFPSIIEALQTKMVVYVLPSITGLTAWIDYIPVKGVTTESNALANTYATDGYQVVKTIELLTGKQAWLDYIPVFESASYNKPWSTDAGGYIPAGGLFSVASLFAAGEQGTWYDPSDLTTLFQDSAGTTPVTAVQQPVGLMLDKSKGLVLGPELVTNGDFSVDANWTKGTGWSIGSGMATTISSNSGTLDQAISLTAGRTYRIGYTIAGWVSGQAQLGFSGGTTVLGPLSGTGNGTRSFVISAATGNSTLRVFKNASLDAFSIDNVTVKELPGNHAFQTTSASRPVLSARYNLLTKTEQFDDAAWINNGGTVTANALVAPDGTSTADYLVRSSAATDGRYQTATAASSVCTMSVYVKKDTSPNSLILLYDDTAATERLNINLTWSGSTPVVVAATGSVSAPQDAGNGWWKITGTTTALTGGNSNRFYLLPAYTAATNGQQTAFWGADLRVSNDALGQPAYQRVNTATDYDTVGFKPYLAFDGVDDSLVTNSIDFTSTDKMTVFAGVRKLSDAAASMLVELSASTFANISSFYLTAPEGTTADVRYGFASRGTAPLAVGQIAKVNTGAAPDTAVITTLGSIAGDSNIIRRNGTAFPEATADQGTGNYGNYPLFIGRRNQATLPFNGRLYSLIVRGAASTTAQITSTETYVNQKTGAY